MAGNQEKLTGTVREAAKVLNVGINTAYQAAREGQIPTMRIGRRQIVQWQKFMKQVKGETA